MTCVRSASQSDPLQDVYRTARLGRSHTYSTLGENDRHGFIIRDSRPLLYEGDGRLLIQRLLAYFALC